RLFPLYIRLFASEDPLRVIYGSVGLLPIFLLWLYLLWVVVLLGVEIAYVAQNYRSLVQAELDEQEMKDGAVRVPSLPDALELTIRLAWHFEHSDGPVGQEQLAREAGMTIREARTVLEVLVRTDLVARSGERWLMARAPRGVAMREVAERWRACTGFRRHGRDPFGEALVDTIHRSLQGTLADAAARLGEPPRVV